jgi:hypothetical protein
VVVNVVEPILVFDRAVRMSAGPHSRERTLASREPLEHGRTPLRYS